MKNKILIVEDDRAALGMLELLFEEAGYIVLAVESAREINPSLASFEPDILLMDIQLGDGDGRLICDEIKTGNLEKDLPIILITALPYHELSKIESLADAVIGKPHDIRNLLHTANQLINRTEI